MKFAAPPRRRTSRTVRGTRNLTAAIATAVALAACGGGGSGDSIGPLPAGTGVVSFSFGSDGGQIVKVNGTTGAVTRLATPCATNDVGFTAADTRPDGYVLAVAGDLYLVDLTHDVDCRKVAAMPVPMQLIAVAADGKVYTVPTDTDASGLYMLYTLDGTTGKVLSTVELTGAPLDFVKGMDFGPDGTLFLSAHDSATGYHVYAIDLVSGALTPRFATTDLANDIDIDSQGLLRSNAASQHVYTIDITSGSVVEALATDRQTEKFLVYR